MIDRFDELSEPWLLEDRLERMRYAINHLCYNDEIFALYDDGYLLELRNNEKFFVAPVWPTAEAFHATMHEMPEGCVLERLSTVEFREHVLCTSDPDESLLAVFPNEAQNYEMLTYGEFTEALDYTDFFRRAELDQLTEADRPMLQKLGAPRLKADVERKKRLWDKLRGR